MAIEKIKNSPTVGIVIPTYNRVHLINITIQIVLNQTFEDFELIIMIVIQKYMREQ